MYHDQPRVTQVGIDYSSMSTSHQGRPTPPFLSYQLPILFLVGGNLRCAAVPTAQWGQKERHEHQGSATSTWYRGRHREDCTGGSLVRELVSSGDEDEDEDEVSILDVKPSHWYNVRQRFSWQGRGTSSDILDEVSTSFTNNHTFTTFSNHFVSL